MEDLKLNRVEDASGRHYEVSPFLAQSYYGVYSPIILKYPSVTTILDRFMDKSRLEAWKKKVGDQAAERIRQGAAQRGSKIHEFLEATLTRKKRPPALTSEEVGYVSNILPILRNCFPLFMEQSIFWIDNENIHIGYAGTLDFCFRADGRVFGLEGERVFVADFKTWRKPKEPKYMISYCLQLAAYAGALNYLTKGIYRVNSALIFGMTQGGRYIYLLDIELMRYYWNMWLRILDAYFLNQPFNWSQETSNSPLPVLVNL